MTLLASATSAFAPRDHRFFTAHLAGALAAAGGPDGAADAAPTALHIAAIARFRQALAELARANALLALHGPSHLPAVRQLHDGLVVLVA